MLNAERDCCEACGVELQYGCRSRWCRRCRRGGRVPRWLWAGEVDRSRPCDTPLPPAELERRLAAYAALAAEGRDLFAAGVVAFDLT